MASFQFLITTLKIYNNEKTSILRSIEVFSLLDYWFVGWVGCKWWVVGDLGVWRLYCFNGGGVIALNCRLCFLRVCGTICQEMMHISIGDS